MVSGRLGMSLDTHGDEYSFLSNPPDTYDYQSYEGDSAPVLCSFLLKVTIENSLMKKMNHFVPNVITAHPNAIQLLLMLITS